MKSDKIIFSEATIEELKSRINRAEPGTDDDLDSVDLDSQDFQYDDAITEYFPSDPDDNVVIPDSPYSTPDQDPAGSPSYVDIAFPWPISVKSQTFVVTGNKTTGAEVVLTWADVTGVQDYEVRITKV